MERVRLGVLGCGAIARNAYLPNFCGAYADWVRVVACADVDAAVARRCAEQFGIARVLSAEELLGDPEVELVVNLTTPEAHYATNLRALEAGKHVYSEKPLALSGAQARELGERARAGGLMCAVAPDTLLGSGHQTARAALDAGRIGVVRHAAAWCSLNIGPARYYRAAAGPLLDFGPYYVGALVALCGPVARVAALGRGRPFVPTGGTVEVDSEVPAHAAVAMEFVSGATGTVGFASDACLYESRLELIGNQGRLELPDPNHFGGVVRLTPAAGETGELPVVHGLGGKDRGAGVVDMAVALRRGGRPRLEVDFSVHVTEVLVAMDASWRGGEVKAVESRCERPVPMPPGGFGRGLLPGEDGVEG